MIFQVDLESNEGKIKQLKSLNFWKGTWKKNY